MKTAAVVAAVVRIRSAVGGYFAAAVVRFAALARRDL